MRPRTTHMRLNQNHRSQPTDCPAIVQVLDLQSIQMGTCGCIVICEAFQTNRALSRLLLDGNPLGEAGGWHVMSALVNSPSLQYVGLTGANFFTTGAFLPVLLFAGQRPQPAVRGPQGPQRLHDRCCQCCSLPVDPGPALVAQLQDWPPIPPHIGISILTSIAQHNCTWLCYRSTS